MATKLRDFCGNEITCASEEAVKLYDTVVEGFVTNIGSIAGPLKRALELDSNFILARCLMGSFLCDPFTPNNPAVKAHRDALEKLYPQALDREKRHIEAFRAHSRGNTPQCVRIFNQITFQYPRDIHAARFAFGDYLTLGEFEQMRDLMSRVVHHCPKDTHIYPYLLSLYAFSLEETNERSLAEELCRESLSLQPLNPWGTHTMAHVMEEAHPAQEGVDFLTSTRQHWSSNALTHHITWHLTLYYFDLNQTDKILQEFDTVMVPQMKPHNLFQILDASSLLWRLNVMGIDPGKERWEVVTGAFQSRVGHPSHSWLETHLMMSLCYGKVLECTARLALARQVIKSMEEFSKQTISNDCTIADAVGVPVCNALLAYGEGRYDEVLSLMLPLKYDFIKFGGSWAQRQVFEMTLIMAAVNGRRYHEAQGLIIELKSRKPHSKVLQALLDRVTADMNNS